MRIQRATLVGVALLAFISITIAQEPAPSSSAPAGVTYFDHDKIDAHYLVGGTLTEGNSGAGHYRILTGRRDKPGEAEIHDLDADVIYVVSGTATFVTGGTAVAPRTTAPGETRGDSIQGGKAQSLTKGDVIIIPARIPHWFKEVQQSPFLYFVVKVH